MLRSILLGAPANRRRPAAGRRGEGSTAPLASPGHGRGSETSGYRRRRFAPPLEPVRGLVAAGTVVAMVAAALALASTGTALAQDAEDCEIIDLGTLGDSASSTLAAEGRWTTEDCDSRFRPGSDAHTYRFRVDEAGRVRISLTSDWADSYLYLLTEDGVRIADNDDNGAGVDARVERDLAPGAYLVEATTVGGRSRGPAGFELALSRVEGCDFMELGTLQPGVDLTASGVWSLETCGSRFVSTHPAYNYTFNLAEPAVVRIDLASDNGDPVLSLASLSEGVIGANDDGGHQRNARIEQHLAPGPYFIEATTYFARDYQPLQADFVLTVRIVDEQARQQGPHVKVEAVHTPGIVVAGDPFPVDYRVGNIGRSDLPDDGTEVWIYLFGQASRQNLDPLAGIWDAGAAYHTSESTASPSSTRIDAVTTFEAVSDQPGPIWVFIGAYTDDPDGVEIGFHGIWHNLMIHSGPTFDPVTVSVDGTAYTVVAEADDDGKVTTTVSSDNNPDEEVHSQVWAEAAYAAGVQTQLLDGIFERPAIARLSEWPEKDPVPVERALSSGALLEAFGQQYSNSLSASGLTGAWAAREALNPMAIEDRLLDAADAAAAQYASMAGDWRWLGERTSDGRHVLSIKDASLLVHAPLAYAESILAPAAEAGGIVAAARSADEGWEDSDVVEMMAEAAACSPEPDALRGALEAAGATDIDELLALDAELRTLRPVHGLAVDNALCASAAADAAVSRFLQRLSVDPDDLSPYLRDVLGLTEPPAAAVAPESHRLRIIARLGGDGRIEHGVELSSGDRVFPEERFLPADASAGTWQLSGVIEVEQIQIGRIRARRLPDGRVEMGFVGAEGSAFTPDVAHLPADPADGVWYRSSEITVPSVPVMGRSD